VIVLRGGYTSRKHRQEKNWLRIIGTALALEHSKRLGVTIQTQNANWQRLDDAWHHLTMRTTKEDRHNQRQKNVAQNNANRRRKRKKK
jgi:hypothetical protein